MSRSFKKNPVSKDGGRSKKASRTLANRKVRRRQNWDKIGEHCSYKRLTCTYDIYDSWSRCTLEEELEYRNKYISHCELTDSYNPDSEFDVETYNINKCILHWKKWYYFK